MREQSGTRARFVRKAVFTGAAGVMLAPLLAGAAFAQSAPEARQSAGDRFNEIIVTAERRQSTAVETPISLTALSSQQLTEQGATSLLDLTTVVPGLRMDKYGPSTFPALRGITNSVSGVGVSPNVAVYKDGFYLPTPTALNFDIPDIENIQVLKGPQGTLFGRNATGGAILLTTREPSDVLTGKASIGYGSYNEVVANGYVSGPLAPGLTASLASSYRYTDGYIVNILNGDRDGTYKGFNVNGKLKWEVSDALTFRLGFDHTYINDPMSMIYRTEGSNATAYFVPGAVTTDRHYRVAASIKPILSKKIDNVNFTAEADLGGPTLKALTSYTHEKDVAFFDYDGSSLPDLDFEYDQDLKTFTQELILAGSNGRLDWSMGGFFLYQNGKMPFEGIGGFNFVDDAGVKNTAFAGYVDATYNIIDNLYLTAGVRYSHEKKKFRYIPAGGLGARYDEASWNSWTPRFNIRYQIDPNTSVYASYSEGFTAGSYSVFSATGGPADPEHLKAYEIGFKHASGGLTVNLAGFHYKYKDMQFVLYTVTGDPLNPVDSNLSNVGSSRINGIEASVTADVNDAITIFAGGTFADSKYEDFDGAVSYLPLPGGGYTTVPVSATGNQLLRAPKWSGNIGFNVHLPMAGGTLDFGPNVYAVSKSYFDAANELPLNGHATVDATVNWTSADKAWKVSLMAKNMFNAYYISYYDPSDMAINVNDAAPRTVRLTLTRQF